MKIIYFIYKNYEDKYEFEVDSEEEIKKWKSKFEKWQIRRVWEGILFEGNPLSEDYINFPFSAKRTIIDFMVSQANIKGKFNPKELENKLFQKP